MTPVTIYNIPETEKGAFYKNGKWLLIALDRPPSPESKELLEKICSALKADHDQDTVTLIHSDENFYSISQDTRLVLSFGVDPSQMGIHIDLERTGIRFLESFAFILTGTLEDLSGSASLKKELWSCMKDFLEETNAHD